LHHLFPYTGRVKLALAPARLLQRVGFLDWAERMGLFRLLPPTLARMQALLPKLSGSQVRLPEVLPPVGPKRARSPCSGMRGRRRGTAPTRQRLAYFQENGCKS
jgi:glycolate oxidase iron-sulfur subunit